MSLSRYNQVNAISMACSTGVEGCNNLTTSWFKEWMENPSINKCVHPPQHTLFTSTVSFSFPLIFNFIFSNPPGSAPIWGPQCTAVPSQQEERKSGTLRGPCTRMLQLLRRLINSCMLCHAPNIPGCWTGQLQWLIAGCFFFPPVVLNLHPCCEWEGMCLEQPVKRYNDVCVAECVIGIWSIVWTQRRSVSRMPPSPLFTLLVTPLVSPWLGTSSEPTGTTYLMSECFTRSMYHVVVLRMSEESNACVDTLLWRKHKLRLQHNSFAETVCLQNDPLIVVFSSAMVVDHFHLED